MLRACSRCGRVHEAGIKCTTYSRADKEAARLRNLSKWHRKSEDIRARSFNLCAICKEEKIVNYLNLEVHHIKKLQEDPSRLLDDDNLICLCSYHHKLADKGKYSEEYLLSLVDKRENDANGIGALL